MKELKARPINNNPQAWELYYENGGELPQALLGMYTSKTEALVFADKYLKQRRETRPREEEK